MGAGAGGPLTARYPEGVDGTPYELAGGAHAVHRLAEAFYARVFADDVLRPLFRDPGEDHVERMALWLTELLGGPALHTEARGGFTVMKAAHHGLRITEEQRARWSALMWAATEDAGLSPAFRDRFRPYVDGGSTLAMRVSH